jgi:hypothetical protein
MSYDRRRNRRPLQQSIYEIEFRDSDSTTNACGCQKWNTGQEVNSKREQSGCEQQVESSSVWRAFEQAHRGTIVKPKDG